MEIRIVENGRTAWAASFQQALARQANALGLAPSVLPASAGPPASGGLLVYLGNALTGGEGAMLAPYLRAGVPILPVLDSPVNAAQHLPADISAVNAFSISRYPQHVWPAALVDEVLAQQWLGRRARRIFISYRRVDAEAIARQLHVRFVKERFDVFLDDISIPPGDDFQRELKWWLNDADLMLLLVSPRLGESKWVLEEITTAGLASIGLVGVRWPAEVYTQRGASEPLVAETLGTDQQLTLGPADLLGGPDAPARQTLSQGAEDRILETALLYRARAIRTRLVNLLPFAQATFAQSYHVAAGAELGDFTLTDAGGGQVLARVLPFRPTAEVLYKLYARARAGTPPPSGLGWFYGENDPQDDRVTSLQWLLGSRTGAPAQYHLWPYKGQP